MLDYKKLVEYYRLVESCRELPQAGLSKPGTPVYDDEEILKCAALYAADIEHLFLMEMKILGLLQSREGLTAKKKKKKLYDVHVEREIKEDKSEFFYSLVSEKEQEAIREKMRAERSQQ
jgi:hypothetical protein